MTDANNFIPSEDPRKLSTLVAAALRATSDLIGCITNDLPIEKREALLAMLAGGGRVGLELTVNKDAHNRVALVTFEREGKRTTVATVVNVGGPALPEVRH